LDRVLATKADSWSPPGHRWKYPTPQKVKPPLI
jgi:hypothetical protein